jgi:hypothetical protein
LDCLAAPPSKEKRPFNFSDKLSADVLQHAEADTLDANNAVATVANKAIFFILLSHFLIVTPIIAAFYDP